MVGPNEISETGTPNFSYNTSLHVLYCSSVELGIESDLIIGLTLLRDWHILFWYSSCLDSFSSKILMQFGAQNNSVFVVIYSSHIFHSFCLTIWSNHVIASESIVGPHTCRAYLSKIMSSGPTLTFPCHLFSFLLLPGSNVSFMAGSAVGIGPAPCLMEYALWTPMVSIWSL